MKRIVIVSVLIVIPVSILLAYFGREDFYLIGITAFVALVVIAVSLLIVILFFIVAKSENNKKYLKVSKYSSLVLLVAIILFSSVFIAAEMARYDTEQAKIFCESKITELEKYKSVTGKYPDTIHEILLDDNKLPIRFENYRFYQTNGMVFRFVIPVMGPNASGYIYDSRDKQWVLVAFIFDLERL